MDIFKWIKTHRLATLTIFAVVFLIIPFSVDKLYSVHAKYKILEMTYTASDILSFYGITLGSATTILALVETIQHTEKLHELDYMRKLTPVLDSNIYNHTAFSHTPLRLLYVNVRPAAYLNRVSVSTSIDPRDLEDIFHGAQIDYLIQNISETSAVNIKVYLNEDILYGPFSLVPGSEASIGIYFFDECGRTVGDYIPESIFDIRVTFTNSDRSRNFVQTERIKINDNIIRLRDDEPRFIPDLDTRTGLLS